jgi:cysteine desulfurase / selenocysteine lyase
MSTSDPFAGGGLPDLETLRRLANELFQAPPTALSAGPGASRALPVVAPPTGVSEPPLPSYEPFRQALADQAGLPSAHVPDLGAPLTSAPTGSFAPQTTSPLTSVPLAAAPPAVIDPRLYGLPGEAELKTLLAIPAAAPSSPLGIPSSASSFYFLEPARPAGGASPVPEFPTDHVQPGGGAAVVRAPFDVQQIRRDFPILQERVNGRPLIWLDNAATTQKPQSVIDRLKYYYEHENSNVHRAAHELAARATDAYEDAREKVRGFLNAGTSQEIVFVRGATEAINLVAQSWGRANIGAGDEIVITWLEHHANIVPWQRLAEEKGARLRVVPVDDDGQVILSEYARLLGPRTKLVSFPLVSNALGTVTPAHAIVEMARSTGARVLVDAAQAVSHMRVDVRSLDADWLVLSGHKLFAPTGIGVLYGKKEVLDQMPPWQGGGNMIKDVTFERTEYQTPPGRFEAGTGNIADAIGLGAAVDYVQKIGIEAISAYEHQLLLYATKGLQGIPGLRLIGTAPEKAGVLSFVLDGFKTEEVGSALNTEGIAVRSGHHCAQPILRRFGVESTVRPSLAFYNTCADIDALVAAVTRIRGSRPPRFRE